MNMAESVAIRFRGVEFVLPSDLPFQNHGNRLTLDFSAGFAGKLVVMAASSPPPSTIVQLPSADQVEGMPGSISAPASTSAAVFAQSAAKPASAVPAHLPLLIEDSQPCPSSQYDLPTWFQRSPEPAVSDHPLTGQQPSPADANELSSKEASVHRSAAETQLGDRASLIPAVPCLPVKAQEPASSFAQQPVTIDRSTEAPAAQTCLPAQHEIDLGQEGSQEGPDGILEECQSIAQARAAVEPAWTAAGQAEIPVADVRQDKTPAAASRPAEKENTPTNALQSATGKSKRKSGSGQASSAKRSGKKVKCTPEQRTQEFSLKWRPLVCKAAAEEDGLPTERWGGTFTALNDQQVCLYGGNSIEEQLGDTWTLDVASATWKRVPVQDHSGKAWHTAEVIDSAEGRSLLVFGGERMKASAEGAATQEHDDEDDLEPLADVCQLDWEANLWLNLPITGESGKLLPHRSGHSTTLLPDNRVLLFGGVDEDGRFRNDAYVIDADRLNCFSLAGIIKGAPPKPRAYHSATLVGGRIVILGGLSNRAWSFKEVYSLSLDGWVWKEHTAEVEGEPPSPRSGHSTVALPGDRHLLVFGGGFVPDDIFYSNVAILDTFTWTWSSPALQDIARPVARGGHGMAAVKLANGRAALVMHGGRAPDERLCRDTWLLEVTRA